MRLFITGANGFLGSFVVRAALERSHSVVGLVRSSSAATRLHERCPGAETVIGDLRSPQDWPDALAATDAVIHLAATKSGSFYEQFPGTVGATEVLLQAMEDAGCDRLVHVSTMAAYNFDARRRGASFDENVPLEDDPLTRDAYTHTKLYQERLVREAATKGMRTTILRPGAVWGPGSLEAGGLAQVVGPLWVAMGDGVTSRFTYIENCAEAIVMAVEHDDAVGEEINVIDDEVPTQAAYAMALRKHGVEVPRAIHIPFGVVHAIAVGLAWLNVRFAGGQARLPGALSRRRLDSYFKPFSFSNAHAKAVLGWQPRYGFHEAVARATGQFPPN